VGWPGYGGFGYPPPHGMVKNEDSMHIKADPSQYMWPGEVFPGATIPPPAIDPNITPKDIFSASGHGSMVDPDDLPIKQGQLGVPGTVTMSALNLPRVHQAASSSPQEPLNTAVDAAFATRTSPPEDGTVPSDMPTQPPTRTSPATPNVPLSSIPLHGLEDDTPSPPPENRNPTDPSGKLAVAATVSNGTYPQVPTTAPFAMPTVPYNIPGPMQGRFPPHTFPNPVAMQMNPYANIAMQGGPAFPAYHGYAPATPFHPHMAGFPMRFGGLGGMNMDMNMDMMGMPFQHPQQSLMPAMNMTRDTSHMINTTNQVSDQSSGPFGQQSDANAMLRQPQQMDESLQGFDLNADFDTDNASGAPTSDTQPGHSNATQATTSAKAASATTTPENGHRSQTEGLMANQQQHHGSDSLQVHHQQTEGRAGQAQVTVQQQLPPQPQSLVTDTEALGAERALQEGVAI
jgi:hypothetical protein